MSDYCVVMTTVASAAEAQRLAQLLVQRDLAACVQISAVTSNYRWEGRLESAAEQLLLIKTRSDRYDAIEAMLQKEHPYDVPEILQVPVSGGAASYLAWVDAETTG